MAYDFSSIFSPKRLEDAAKSVQTINAMPWVYSAYSPTAQAAPAPAPVATPLEDMLGLTPTQGHFHAEGMGIFDPFFFDGGGGA